MCICRLKNITKQYNNKIVVNNINFNVNQNEILVLLGPSGCGKSTTLHLIAGLEKPDKGVISIKDKIIYSSDKKIFIPPNKRGVGLVFQNYALWPHLNIFENIAYPLKIKKRDKNGIKKEVEKMLKFVRLKGKQRNYPYELSGGEQQRVALARALIMKPNFLLLDEPFSHLDAKLREDMLQEIKKINKETGISMVYVTHDQREAMEIADRIIIMNNGEIIQQGDAPTIYNNPKNEFVATFIGETNIVKSKVINKGNNQFFKIANNVYIKNNYKIIDDNISEVTLSIRPENIKLCSQNEIGKGKIKNQIYKGSFIKYLFNIGNETTLKVQTPSYISYKNGEKVGFNIRDYTII